MGRSKTDRNPVTTPAPKPPDNDYPIHYVTNSRDWTAIETTAVIVLILNTLITSIVAIFLFAALSDSVRGGSTRADLLIRKLVLDVRTNTNRSSGSGGRAENTTTWLLGRWTRRVARALLKFLGTPEETVDVLLTYLMALVGNTNVCWSDFTHGLDLAVAPNFGGRVPLAYVNQGTDIDFRTDTEELRLVFEFINYSEIIYGWPQFCKMALVSGSFLF